MRSIILDNNILKARFVTTGASLVALEVPGRDGEKVDVALGFDDTAAYLDNIQNVGANVGRVANRTAGAMRGMIYQTILERDVAASGFGEDIGGVLQCLSVIGRVCGEILID